MEWTWTLLLFKYLGKSQADMEFHAGGIGALLSFTRGPKHTGERKRKGKILRNILINNKNIVKKLIRSLDLGRSVLI